ncbi:MAG: site-specific integrase [Bacteroides sp.]|nr:site-specific integrase [Bacteroides sp.]
MDKNGIYDFMLSVVTDLERQGRYSTAHVYRCALKAVITYGGISFNVEQLTPTWLYHYQEYLLKQELLWNTISTYMRMLRAVYNRAVDLGMTPYIPRQFKNVFTGRYVNHQRALKKEEIRLVLSNEEAVQETDLPEEASDVSLSSRDLRWARACLELMLRFHGMPFIDLANLRKADLRNGYLTVRRHKTGMPLSVAVDAAAMKLIRRYANTDPSSPYLLDILDARLTGCAAYENYQRVLRLLNLRLYQLSCRCGVGKRVSSYTARHTWATIAKSCGVSIEMISEALGYASISTTQGYLKQFDSHEIEKANKIIISYIFK